MSTAREAGLPEGCRAWARSDDEPDGPENDPRPRLNSVSIAHVARTPEADSVSDREARAPDLGKGGVGARGLEPPTSAV
jgi:hypothetical protein